MDAILKPAQKIDGTGKVHLTRLGRRGGRVLACSGRTMYDLVPASGFLIVDCRACLAIEKPFAQLDPELAWIDDAPKLDTITPMVIRGYNDTDTEEEETMNYPLDIIVRDSNGNTLLHRRALHGTEGRAFADYTVDLSQHGDALIVTVTLDETEGEVSR